MSIRKLSLTLSRKLTSFSYSWHRTSFPNKIGTIDSQVAMMSVVAQLQLLDERPIYFPVQTLRSQPICLLKWISSVTVLLPILIFRHWFNRSAMRIDQSPKILASALYQSLLINSRDPSNTRKDNEKRVKLWMNSTLPSSREGQICDDQLPQCVYLLQRLFP